MLQVKTIYYAAIIALLPCLALASNDLEKSENTNEIVTHSLSAAELATLAGFGVQKRLIVGKIDEVKAGKIKFAETIPTTYATLIPPDNIPTTHPLAQIRPDSPEEFDAALFQSYLCNPTKSPYFDFFFEPGNTERYTTLLQRLRPVMQPTSVEKTAPTEKSKQIKTNQKPPQPHRQEATAPIGTTKRTSSKWW